MRRVPRSAGRSRGWGLTSLRFSRCSTQPSISSSQQLSLRRDLARQAASACCSAQPGHPAQACMQAERSPGEPVHRQMGPRTGCGPATSPACTPRGSSGAHAHRRQPPGHARGAHCAPGPLRVAQVHPAGRDGVLAPALRRALAQRPVRLAGAACTRGCVSAGTFGVLCTPAMMALPQAPAEGAWAVLGVSCCQLVSEQPETSASSAARPWHAPQASRARHAQGPWSVPMAGAGWLQRCWSALTLQLGLDGQDGGRLPPARAVHGLRVGHRRPELDVRHAHGTHAVQVEVDLRQGCPVIAKAACGRQRRVIVLCRRPAQQCSSRTRECTLNWSRKGMCASKGCSEMPSTVPSCQQPGVRAARGECVPPDGRVCAGMRCAGLHRARLQQPGGLAHIHRVVPAPRSAASAACGATRVSAASSRQLRAQPASPGGQGLRWGRWQARPRCSGRGPT